MLFSFFFFFFFFNDAEPPEIYSLPTRRSSDLKALERADKLGSRYALILGDNEVSEGSWTLKTLADRSEEHTSELQSPCNLVCRLLLEKKKNKNTYTITQTNNKT